ncbi:MAG: hypothetical protein FWG64_08175 [Firmicutes bacterium]|nr:hypothetical protein [Bacillota bacterium]
MQNPTKYLFYGVSALLLIYAIWSYSRGAEIIAEALQTGQISLSANLYDIISFHMANSGQYFIFAIILAGIGIIIGKKSPNFEPPPIANSTNADDSDDWFNENEEIVDNPTKEEPEQQ